MQIPGRRRKPRPGGELGGGVRKIATASVIGALVCMVSINLDHQVTTFEKGGEKANTQCWKFHLRWTSAFEFGFNRCTITIEPTSRLLKNSAMGSF